MKTNRARGDLAASGNSRITERAVMDLPQPDSPSNAKVSPFMMCSVKPIDRPCRRCASMDNGCEIVDLQQGTHESGEPSEPGSRSGRSSFCLLLRHVWRRTRCCFYGQGSHSRIKCILYSIGKQIGAQYQRKHKTESSEQGPPYHWLTRHFQSRGIDHRAKTDHGRIDTRPLRKRVPPQPEPIR